MEYPEQANQGAWECEGHWTESQEVWTSGPGPEAVKLVKVTFPAGTSLGHEVDDPINLLETKIAAVGLLACRSPAIGEANKRWSEGVDGSRESICSPSHQVWSPVLCQTLELLHK